MEIYCLLEKKKVGAVDTFGEQRKSSSEKKENNGAIINSLVSS